LVQRKNSRSACVSKRLGVTENVAKAGSKRFGALTGGYDHTAKTQRSSRPKPIFQNLLVLHRAEFGDLAKVHHLFAVRLIG
jgi:hypothetical protein